MKKPNEKDEPSYTEAYTKGWINGVAELAENLTGTTYTAEAGNCPKCGKPRNNAEGDVCEECLGDVD